MSDSIDDCLLRLHPADPVAIAKRSLQPGERLARAAGGSLTVLDEVPAGHKLALVDLASGQPVLRYGYPIGFAEGPIRAGSWVHTHNLGVGEPAPAGSYRLAGPVEPKPSRRTFAGFLRPGGRVGTRNYIAVIATVSCSANLASQVARAFPPQRLAAYPNVDGVIALVHTSGCGLPPGSRSHAYLRRVLANMAKHPNVAAAVFVGLGCELLQVDDCQPLYTPQEIERLAPLGLVIQESGGFQKSLAAGIAQVEQLLPQVNALQRTPQPLAALTLALQCGGSDGWSGVTANPLVGRVADAIVLEGGTAVLGETPEIFGAEHLLTSRVSAPEVAEKLFERMRWWLEQARLRGFEINNNPAPGNKKGGLTNIFEKSLGAVAKAGSTPLNGVFEYGEWIDRRGLVFMDTPGNDPLSVTGQVAGGCNLILFTTGRGSVYGSAAAPCIKIATHSSLNARMPTDMDFNAGLLLEGQPWEQVAGQLLERVVAVASGERSASERNGLSDHEFIPWQPDATL